VRGLCAEDHLADLIATAQTIESAYQEFARLSRAGMRRLGALSSIPTYRRTTTFRIHEPSSARHLPDRAYTRRMLAFWYGSSTPPTTWTPRWPRRPNATAVALSPAKRIAVVLGEQALHTRFGTPDEHAEQLTHLLACMRLPFVSVGVIPAGVQRQAVANIGFWVFDDNAVRSGELPPRPSR